nr:putative ORF1 [Marmot picobirnavirus]
MRSRKRVVNKTSRKGGRMTANQINYWNLQEKKRNNLAVETETNRHNVASENIDLAALQESSRHNVTTEGQGQQNINLNWAKLQEDVRSHRANEELKGVDLNITGSHYERQDAANKLVAKTTADLNASRAALNEIEKEWAGLKNSAQVALTQTQKNEVDALIRKVDAEMANLYSQAEYANEKGVSEGFNRVYNGLNSLSRIIDSFIPG